MVAYDKAASIGEGLDSKRTTVVPNDGMVWSSKGVTQRIVVRLRDGWREWLENSMDPEGRCRQDYAPLVSEVFAGVLFYSTVPVSVITRASAGARISKLQRGLNR